MASRRRAAVRDGRSRSRAWRREPDAGGCEPLQGGCRDREWDQGRRPQRAYRSRTPLAGIGTVVVGGVSPPTALTATRADEPDAGEDDRRDGTTRSERGCAEPVRGGGVRASQIFSKTASSASSPIAPEEQIDRALVVHGAVSSCSRRSTGGRWSSGRCGRCSPPVSTRSSWCSAPVPTRCASTRISAARGCWSTRAGPMAWRHRWSPRSRPCRTTARLPSWCSETGPGSAPRPCSASRLASQSATRRSSVPATRAARAHPVAIHRSLWSRLPTAGEDGARALGIAPVDVDCTDLGAPGDADTPGELATTT